jgi:ribosomal protein L21E
MTPFQVLFGRLPREFGTIQANQSNIPDLAAWLHEREVIRDLLRQQLLRAQQRMKQQANKHRSEREFAVGDSVYLKLQPYIQTSIARRPHQKLAFRYYGPYTILQRVGQVAYKLNLPASSQIHAVVHVSLLKNVVGPDVLVSPQLPPSINVLQTVRAPAEILAHRLVRLVTPHSPKCLCVGKIFLLTWRHGKPLMICTAFTSSLRHGDMPKRKKGGMLRPLHQTKATREQEHETYVEDARQEDVIQNKKRRWN